MTHQRALSPLTLLFISLLCYGFVLVWTQNVAHETTTIFEDLSTPISPAQVKILTGGNFSVSVSPWESTTGSPDLSTQSSLALQDTVNENYTTVTPKDSLTIPPPTAMESYSTMAPMGGADDELASALGSTGALFTTANINAINTVPEVQISSTDTPSEGSTEMILGNDTTDTKATGNGVSASSDLPVLLRTMRRTSSVHQDGGLLAWRVKVQSSLSKEKAITDFFEKACDVIFKNLHMKDIIITWGPDKTRMKCV